MTESTTLVNGGAMSKFDRGTIMRRAWAIFREIYKYPEIKFTDIGRKCFAWALRKAWAEARETARLAALTAEAKAERIEALQGVIQHAAFIDHGPTWRTTVTAARDEISQLQSAYARGRSSSWWSPCDREAGRSQGEQNAPNLFQEFGEISEKVREINARWSWLALPRGIERLFQA